MADKPSTKKKRLVKNPETFRERAIKAVDEGDKPKRSARLKQVGKRVVMPVTTPVGKAGSKVSRLKPVRKLRKPARLIGKVVVPVYLRNSWKELRLVTWPTLQESRQLTFAVLVFAIAFALIIAVVDFGLDKLFRNILLK